MIEVVIFKTIDNSLVFLFKISTEPILTKDKLLLSLPLYVNMSLT